MDEFLFWYHLVLMFSAFVFLTYAIEWIVDGNSELALIELENFSEEFYAYYHKGSEEEGIQTSQFNKRRTHTYLL